MCCKELSMDIGLSLRIIIYTYSLVSLNCFSRLSHFWTASGFATNKRHTISTNSILVLWHWGTADKSKSRGCFFASFKYIPCIGHLSKRKHIISHLLISHARCSGELLLASDTYSKSTGKSDARSLTAPEI